MCRLIHGSCGKFIVKGNKARSVRDGKSFDLCGRKVVATHHREHLSWPAQWLYHPLDEGGDDRALVCEKRLHFVCACHNFLGALMPGRLCLLEDLLNLFVCEVCDAASTALPQRVQAVNQYRTRFQGTISALAANGIRLCQELQSALTLRDMHAHSHLTL